MDETQEILDEFIQETREHLSVIEPDLLEMERQGSQVSTEIVNRIFRAIHSTKGGASFLAFEALKNFSHAMESVLMLIRDGELPATPHVVDALLRGVDILRAMIEDVENSDQVPCAKELDLLKGILAAAAAGVAPAAAPAVSAPAVASVQAPPPVAPVASAKSVASEQTAPSVLEPLTIDQFDVPRDQVSAALAQGMRLFHVALGKDHDAAAVARQIDDVGRLLATNTVPGGVAILCATVLDQGMLTGELGGRVAAIHTVPVDGLRAALRGAASVAPAGAPAAASPALPSSRPASSGAAPLAETQPHERGSSSGDKSGRRDGAADTLRVRVDLLNRLMNAAGELVLGRNQLLRSLKETTDSVAGLAVILQHIDRVTTELQEGIMQTRMQPVGTLFGRYPRVVRDLARTLGKQITLHTEGEDVELDKSIIEALADPLTHIIRNSVDHAIESPEERQKCGKSPVGRINLLAFHESGQVNIVVSDDGRGISRSKVVRKAVDKGLISQADSAHISEREVLNLVLMPGFSTASTVSDISGRGVGMDVVRTNVEKLGGHVELETEEEHGTTVTLRLPLTLAIIPSLIVGATDARFAVPQVGIDELVWVRAEDVQERIEKIQGHPVLRLRGRLLPLVRLADVLQMRREFVDPGSGELREDRRQSIADERLGTNESGRRQASNRRRSADGDYNVLVLRAGANRFGLVVDELFESEEIVLKPLPSYLKQIPCFAGTTILGDGRVTMILDPGGIASLAKLSFASVSREETRRQAESERTQQDGEERAVILFNGAPGEVFAVPQDRVLRLERIERGQVETLGGREFVKYRGQGLPILRLDSHFPVARVPDGAEEMFLIIPKNLKQGQASVARAGILAFRILDARDVSVELQRPLFRGPGLKGSAIVDGHLTMFLDPVELMQVAGFAEGGVD